MGKGGGAHVWLLGVGREIDEVGHPMSNAREVRKVVLANGFDSHLEAEVGNYRDEVAVADPLAVAVDSALYVRGPTTNASESVCNTAAGVVVEMHTNGRSPVRSAEVVIDVRHHALDVGRERSAVGIAEHEAVGSSNGGCFEDGEAELGVAAVAVEEVLGIEEHFTAFGLEEGNRVGHHGNALFECGLQCAFDVVVPRLANDADGAGASVQEVCERWVGVGLSLCPARRAKGDHL